MKQCTYRRCCRPDDLNASMIRLAQDTLGRVYWGAGCDSTLGSGSGEVSESVPGSACCAWFASIALTKAVVVKRTDGVYSRQRDPSPPGYNCICEEVAVDEETPQCIPKRPE